ncbi:MAG TPA: thioredoxin family protein [Sulfurovum sp.]|nr:thioredoxin family protein [Sulfurovum sp.]
MRKIVIVLSLLSSILFADRVITTHDLGWMNNLDEAKTIAEKDKKPIMLYLHSQRCFYCPKILEEVLPDPEVRAFVEKNFVMLDLDVATGSDSIEESTANQAPQRFIVSMTPAFVFMGPKEEKLYRKGKKHMIIYGFWKPDELITWGKEALKRFNKLYGAKYAK